MNKKSTFMILFLFCSISETLPKFNWCAPALCNSDAPAKPSQDVMHVSAMSAGNILIGMQSWLGLQRNCRIKTFSHTESVVTCDEETIY